MTVDQNEGEYVSLSKRMHSKQRRSAYMQINWRRMAAWLILLMTGLCAGAQADGPAMTAAVAGDDPARRARLLNQLGIALWNADMLNMRVSRPWSFQ